MSLISANISRRGLRDQRRAPDLSHAVQLCPINLHAMTKAEANPRLIAENRKARFDYFIEERYEAGLALQGWEVKAMRAGRAQLKEAYVYLRSGEAFLYRRAPRRRCTSTSTHVIADPTRTRKLLLNHSELEQPDRRGRARAATRWCRSSCTGRAAAPSSSSASPRARSSTTSARPRRTATGSATRRASCVAAETHSGASFGFFMS